MKVNKREIKSETALRTVFDIMYYRSKNFKEPFYGLIEVMQNREAIITAVHNIKSNRGSKTKGIDNKEINHYLQMQEDELIRIIRNAIRNYRPKPVRRKYIEKPGSDKKRPLGIPTIIDRIMQELARMVLEPIAEGKFYEYSYGFRPYRSTEHAVAEVLERIRRSHTYWVIEGDIKSFFDNINHNKLLAIMWNMGVKDKRFLMIIKKMLKAGIMEDGKFYRSNLGTPQGGIISPLLANIYLNNFDWMIAKMYQQHPARKLAKDPIRTGLAIVQKRHKKCHLVRYADDWIILCETEEQAKTILRKTSKYFMQVLKLELSLEKTLITNVLMHRIKFLGFEIFAQEQFRRKTNKIVGKALPRMDKLKQKIREIAKEIRKIHLIEGKFAKHDRATNLELINSKIVGISEYYKISNCSHIFKSQDQKIYNQAWKTWRRLNGNKGLWADFTTPATEVDNRIKRHHRRNDRLFYLEVDNVKIGLTKFQFSGSAKAMKFNNEMTPYTTKGRTLYTKRTGKSFLLGRDTIYSDETLRLRISGIKNGRGDPKRNFEFIMNREYAYNRDKGKCKCCDIILYSYTIHCHHIKPWLPLNEVNKVPNLATLCIYCHRKIHKKEPIIGTKKMMDKIKKYRKLLEKPKEKV